jgi:opacity protein-like surface antigen
MRFLMSFVMMVLLAGFAFAELPITDMVDLDLNMRPRLLIDGKDFDADTGMRDFGDMRTMVGINVMPNENVTIRVRMRESRFLGTQGSLAGPGAVFEAQEAYATIHNAFDKPMCFTMGRFEYKHGRGRIMGATAWSVFGPRTYDGIHVGFKPDYGYWEVMVTRVTEAGAADRHLVVISGALFEKHFKPIFMADIDNRDFGFEDLDRLYTAGFNYHRMFGDNIKFVMDGAYQFGTVSDLSVGAYMVAADVYYKFDAGMHPYIGVGVDMTSGDDDATDDANGAYSNGFYTGHAFRGMMDYFVGDTGLGLTDIIFHLGFKPDNGMKFMVDAHMFAWGNDAISADNGDEYTAIGNEVDFRVSIPMNDNVDFQGGYGIFMASDDYIFEADMASWAYLSTIITF